MDSVATSNLCSYKYLNSDHCNKAMRKGRYIQASFLLVGFVLGIISVNYLNSLKQDTYFEANNISNFFFMNKSESVLVHDIIDGSWKYICTEMPFDLKYNQIVFGKLIDEGLLDYLQKVVVIGDSGRIGIMNFDERLYKISNDGACFDFNSAKITKETKQLRPDPDGLGKIFTTYTFGEVEGR